MKKPKSVTIKTGSVDAFMVRMKGIMRALDKKTPLKPSYTIRFADPRDMLHLLNTKKLELIGLIRHHPDSVTNLARAVKRNRAAVYRDICEMKKAGLVTAHEEKNPGHGRLKIIALVANELKLEAVI